VVCRTSGTAPVGISRGVPRGKTGYRRLRELEPGPWFKSVAPGRYLTLYHEILERLDAPAIRDRLLALAISRSCCAGSRLLIAITAPDGATATSSRSGSKTAWA
jgi:hypothetical protein